MSKKRLKPVRAEAMREPSLAQDTASANEYTGLMPAPAQTEGEQEAYDDIFPSLPVSDKYTR